MPLARIDLIKGKSPEYRRAISEVVFINLVELFKENRSFGNGIA